MHLGEISGGYVNEDISGAKGDTCVFSWVHKIRGCYNYTILQVRPIGIQMGVLLTVVITKTDSFKYSFFPHSVELWNLLPSDVALANYNSFKNSILNIL